jgi:hypothetical protein
MSAADIKKFDEIGKKYGFSPWNHAKDPPHMVSDVKKGGFKDRREAFERNQIDFLDETTPPGSRNKGLISATRKEMEK